MRRITTLLAAVISLSLFHSWMISSVVLGLFPPQQPHHLVHDAGHHHPAVAAAGLPTTTTTYRPQILDTVVLHDHWRKLIRRRVQMSEGLSSSSKNTNETTIIVDFELVGQRDPDQAVLIFVWHRRDDRRTRNSNNNDDEQEEQEEEDTITVVREYMPSQDAFGYGLAAGMVDESDHGNVEGAARRELVEECGLHGGTWHCLTPLSSSNGGVVLDKYCTTKTTVYLVINPTPVSGDHHSIHLLHRDDAAETGM
jgi:8-oxo-dGTP pyrophosphatase MutT (NUDIX family)